MLCPYQKTVIEGRVLESEYECIQVRSDDNAMHSICGVNAKKGDEVIVTIRSSLFHLVKINDLKIVDAGTSEKLIAYLESMSLCEKLGQMMIVRTQENLTEELDFIPGGYILFANDFRNKSAEEIEQMVRSLQQQKHGALVMVDEEGGDVVRVSSVLFEEGYPSAQEDYLSGGWDAVKKNLINRSQMLASLGFQVNLNPVVDISTNPEDYIYSRTFGQDEIMTSQYVSLAVQTQKEAGLLSCLKHFPGYGNNRDTHRGFSVDYRSLNEYRIYDFLPFQAGVDSGAELVMMSHIIMSSVDSQTPASLSSNVHQLLKEELNYDGLVITDDLTMDAIEHFTSNPLVSALSAGNHLLLTTDPKVTIDELVEAVEKNQLSLNQIDESVLKILEIKEKLGCLR